MKKSKSGDPIYNNDDYVEKGFEPASGDPSIEEISDHIEKYIGEIHTVYHEIISDKVHIDVHMIKPTEERPYHTLVTSGMSDRPMHTPEDVDDSRFAELSICLPKEWKLSDDDLENEKYYWPVFWLKYLARFPHDYSTWLSFGHTIPNGNPAEPLTEGTQLNTMLLLPSVVFDSGFHTLELENKIIDFYTLIPIYQEELDLKLEKGVRALYDGFDRYNVSDVVDLNRPNTVAKKKKWWQF